MTVGQDNAITTSPPGAEPQPNSFQRILGYLFSPDPTFSSLARRPAPYATPTRGDQDSTQA